MFDEEYIKNLSIDGVKASLKIVKDILKCINNVDYDAAIDGYALLQSHSAVRSIKLNFADISGRSEKNTIRKLYESLNTMKDGLEANVIESDLKINISRYKKLLDADK